ncbi:MAG: alpha/beta hydrolase [Chitinophagales bacterium]|nr:alpha/beta hydrolase [Chitinophagales bacterium]
MQDIEIKCSDNTTIKGSLYKSDHLKGAVLIAPATGIKRQFYHDFAEWLAEHGYGAITYDNQGIGGSLKGSIRLCPASLVSWGKVDQTAGLERLKQEFPDTKYHLVGHSAGGQLVGLMENAEDLSSVFNYACSSGSLRNLKGGFKLQAYFFMYVFIPVSNKLINYTNTPLMNMGEPLPQKVASQWSEWCRGKGYIEMALGKTIRKHSYDTLDIPSLWVNATDDDIAINKNVDDMTRVFKKLQVERLTLKPSDESFENIGHMDFFRRNHRSLWRYAINWLDKHK